MLIIFTSCIIKMGDDMKHRTRNEALIAIRTVWCIGSLMLPISVSASQSLSSPAAVDVGINNNIDYQSLNDFINSQNDGQAKFFEENEGVLYISKKSIILKKPVNISYQSIYQPKLLTDLGFHISFDTSKFNIEIKKNPHYYLIDYLVGKSQLTFSLPPILIFKNNLSLIQTKHSVNRPIVSTLKFNLDNFIILLLWALTCISVFVLVITGRLLLMNKAKKKRVNKVENRDLVFLQQIYIKNKEIIMKKKEKTKKEKDFA